MTHIHMSIYRVSGTLLKVQCPRLLAQSSRIFSSYHKEYSTVVNPPPNEETGDSVNTDMEFQQSNNNSLAAQKKMNDEILERFKSLAQFPLEEYETLKGEEQGRSLTQKEKQLDEELTEFLRQYSQSNLTVVDAASTTANATSIGSSSTDFDNTTKYPYFCLLYTSRCV